MRRALNGYELTTDSRSIVPIQGGRRPSHRKSAGPLLFIPILVASTH